MASCGYGAAKLLLFPVTMTTANVKVRTGQDSFGIEMNDFPELKLENEAENGRANTELVTRLEEILGEKPGIVSGHTSSRKKLKFEMSRKEFERRLENFNG